MPWSREDLTRLVELEAHQQGVDPRLAVAVAEQESGFNPNDPLADKGAVWRLSAHARHGQTAQGAILTIRQITSVAA